MAKRSRHRGCCWLVCMLAACSMAGYSPFPLDLDVALPSDAFARCHALLLREFGTLTEVDAEAFRLQTAWQPIADPPGDRRATVYRDQTREHSLAVIVELRRLSVPLIGTPRWTTPRGDHAAERRLADRLVEALRDPLPPDATHDREVPAEGER